MQILKAVGAKLCWQVSLHRKTFCG